MKLPAASPSSLAAALGGGLLLSLLLIGCDAGEVYRVVTTPTVPAPSPTVRGAGALPLERFHYVAALTIQPQRTEGGEDRFVVSTEGDFQSPNRHAFTYTIKRGGNAVSQGVVIIGERAWLREGDGGWRQTSRRDPRVVDLLATAFSTARPGFLGGAAYGEVRESVLRLPSTPEPVNKVAANHYRVGSAGFEFFRTFLAHGQLPQQARDLQWDLWLAEEGAWPVRLRASGTVAAGVRVLEELEVPAPAAWELRVDISRPNDPTLAVRAPGRR